MIHAADRAAGARLPAPFPPVTQYTVRNSLELLPSVRYTLYGHLSRGFARNFRRKRRVLHAAMAETGYDSDTRCIASGINVGDKNNLPIESAATKPDIRTYRSP